MVFLDVSPSTSRDEVLITTWTNLWDFFSVIFMIRLLILFFILSGSAQASVKSCESLKVDSGNKHDQHLVDLFVSTLTKHEVIAFKKEACKRRQHKLRKIK